MLEKQVIPLSFGIGVDTKTDPKQVIATKLLSLQNCVFGTGGEFKKRNGFKSLAGLSSGTMISSFQDQLLAFDGQSGYSYSKQQNSFVQVGSRIATNISTKPLIKQFVSSEYGSMAYANGYYGVMANGNIVNIVDSETNRVILSDIVPGAAFISRVIDYGNNLVFIYTTSSGTIGFKAYDTSNSFATTLGTWANDFFYDITTRTGALDAKTINGKIVVVYSSATNVKYFSVSGAFVQSSVTTTAYGQMFSIGIFGDPTGNTWVGTITSQSSSIIASYFILNPAVNAFVLTLTNIETFVFSLPQLLVPMNINGVYNGTSGDFYYSIFNNRSGGITVSNGQLNFIRRAVKSISGSVIVSPYYFMLGAQCESKPFMFDGNSYVCISYGNYSWSEEPTYFLTKNDGTIAAKYAVGDSGSYYNKTILPDVIQTSSTDFVFPFDEISRIDISGSNPTNNAKVIGVSQMTVSFNSQAITTTLGNNLLIGGGLLEMYDGKSLVEHGFNIFPELFSVYATASSGGALSSGTYQYSLVYEWTDAQGQLHQSAPSVPISVSVSASQKVTIALPTLKLTQKQNVSLTLYRTVANGTQFYQVSPSAASGTYIPNDQTNDFVSYVDSLADSAIIGNNQLYTNGGEFENIEIPSTDIIWQYQNRMLGVYSEAPTTIGFSKQVVSGQFPSPVEFSDSFIITVPEAIGYVTAGIQMDDKCIIFGPKSIYYMVGKGPSANGLNNDFTTPMVISTDCGCIDKKSVVMTPVGVMFKSAKGIYLLERSLQVFYIGADVESYNSSTITSVQMLSNVNQVRFTLDSGIALVYDYYFKQWGTFSNVSAVDSTIYQDLYTYLSPNNFVYQETPGLFTDDGAFIPISLKTAWFSFNKLQGFQRAYKLLVLGEWKSAHTLKFDFSVNFDSSVVQTVQAPALTSLTPYQDRIFITNQKCESFQLTITEQQTGSFGEGLTLSALAFEVGGKKGAFKLSAANSYG